MSDFLRPFDEEPPEPPRDTELAAPAAPSTAVAPPRTLTALDATACPSVAVELIDERELVERIAAGHLVYPSGAAVIRLGGEDGAVLRLVGQAVRDLDCLIKRALEEAHGTAIEVVQVGQAGSFASLAPGLPRDVASRAREHFNMLVMPT